MSPQRHPYGCLAMAPGHSTSFDGKMNLVQGPVRVPLSSNCTTVMKTSGEGSAPHGPEGQGRNLKWLILPLLG